AHTGRPRRRTHGRAAPSELLSRPAGPECCTRAARPALSFCGACCEDQSLRPLPRLRAGRSWSPGLLCHETAFLQVDHAHDHGTTGIERKVLKAPASIELAYFIIKGMREDAKTSDLTRRPQRCCQRKLKQ